MYQATLQAAHLGITQQMQGPSLLQQGLQQQAMAQLMGMSDRLIPPEPLAKEDAFGEIVAWRCWLSRKLPILTSIYREDFIWMPGQIEEAEGVGDHNQLGFHAWRDERSALAYALGQGPVTAVGRVRLWGQVIHHERGYRAQFARIESLDTLLSFNETIPRCSIETLRRHYGVEQPREEKR
jgi:hypothetical protein